MRDEPKLKEILRRIRTETAWEANCSADPATCDVRSDQFLEVYDAEMDTICFVRKGSKHAYLVVAIFDWLIEEAEAACVDE